MPALTNFTIQVPFGTTNHGDPRIICTPTKWHEVMLFFAINYFSHAFTMKSAPGEKSVHKLLDFASALLFPYSGISRGIEALFRHSAWSSKDDLQMAVRSGALCAVVRSGDWKPTDGMELKNVSIDASRAPGSVKNLSDTAEDIELLGESRNNTVYSYAIVDPECLNEWPNRRHGKPLAERRLVHGLQKLPDDYRLVILSSNVVLTWDKEHGKSLPVIASSFNIPKVVVAILQVIFASVTLYRTRGDQITRYGYAAFGLTVIPYIVMSLINLFGTMLTPDYPAIYVVRSLEMNEAEARGGYFDGIVGSVIQETNPEEEQYIVKIVSKNSTFSLKPKFANVERPGKTDDEIMINWKRSNDASHRVPVHIPACTNYKTEGKWLWSVGRSSNFGYFTFFILGTIPFAVIGGLTHFHSGQSTKPQRIWNMGWLVFGCIWGAMWARGTNFDYGAYTSSTMWELAFICFFGSFAIGGFVTVGQMLESYGSCVLLS